MRFALALAALLAARAEADPSSPLLDAAAAAVRSGERARAASLLGKADRADLTGEQREAVALLYAELKDYAAAEKRMNALIRVRPDEARLRLYLATIVARAGDRAATLAALAEARARAPSAQDRQRMAFLHQDFKDYGPARELLDGLVSESPGDLSVRLDRASLAAQSGDSALALADLAAAAALEPGPAERRRMAALYGSLGDSDRARELLGGLIAASPGEAGPLLELAALDAGDGRRAAALEALAAARARGPGRDELRRAASLYDSLDERDEARAVLAGAARAAPKDASAWRELAAHDARSGRRAEALESLKKALAARPDLQDRQAVSLIYDDLGEGATARRMIDALIAEQPGDPQLRLNRAYFAAGAGDKAGALAFLEETLARAPDPDDRKRVATLYERLGEPEKAAAARGETTQKSR